MSQRGSDAFPEEIAISTQSAADGAANRFRSLVADDLRLLRLIDAWPALPEDTRDAIVRLAGCGPDGAGDLDDVAVTPARKAVSR